MARDRDVAATFDLAVSTTSFDHWADHRHHPGSDGDEITP
jgi:hypothetical protein